MNTHYSKFIIRIIRIIRIFVATLQLIISMMTTNKYQLTKFEKKIYTGTFGFCRTFFWLDSGRQMRYGGRSGCKTVLKRSKSALRTVLDPHRHFGNEIKTVENFRYLVDFAILLGPVRAGQKFLWPQKFLRVPKNFFIRKFITSASFCTPNHAWGWSGGWVTTIFQKC